MLKLSIVTVCLNSARCIGDTLASVNAQTHAEIEHIVIDGGSTDGTQDLVRQRGERVCRLISEPDRGIYDAMNKGLALATGDIVGFLNADDVFASPEAVERIAQAFTPGVDASYGDVVYVNSTDPSRTIRYWRAGAYRPGLCASGWAPPHPTLYVRREVLVGHGGFNDRMRIAADFDLALRLFDVAGIGVRYIPETLGTHAHRWRVQRFVEGRAARSPPMGTALRAQGLPAGWGWSMRRIARRVLQVLSRPRNAQN